MAVKVKITQLKSSIDRSQKQKDTLRALGLTKVNSTAEHKLNPNIQGMINKVSHLVSVTVSGAKTADEEE